VHDKLGLPDGSEDDLPHRESRLQSNTPQHHDQDQILEQPDSIGQAKESERSSATPCLLLSPKRSSPYTKAKPTHSTSRPPFSKLASTGLDAAGYKPGKQENNNTRDSDPEKLSLDSDQWSLPVPSQAHSNNGNGQSDPVSCGVLGDLVH
jgi:hypothetical protein